MKRRAIGSLKIQISLLFSLLIAIAFSVNWSVATQTMEGEKIEDLEEVLHHVLIESTDEYITGPLDATSDLSFLYVIPHNRMILNGSEASHVKFLLLSSPYRAHEHEISVSVWLSNGLYLNAISDDLNVRTSVEKYSEKLLVRYAYSLLAILIVSILLLSYYMRPLGILAQKARGWKNGDPFEFSLDHPGKEIEEVSDAFSALIRRLEGYRTKEKELFKEAAHELKTPLALMRSRLDVYEKNEEYPKLRVVAELGNDIERLSAELKNVLFLESSDFEDPVSVNLNRILRTIISKVDILAQRKRLQIHLPTQNFEVYASEKLLKKVLTALVENAMTYAAEGSMIGIEIDPLRRSLSVANDVGEEKYLFSSRIGEKMLKRLSQELHYTYEIFQNGTQYKIDLIFQK